MEEDKKFHSTSAPCLGVRRNISNKIFEDFHRSLTNLSINKNELGANLKHVHGIGSRNQMQNDLDDLIQFSRKLQNNFKKSTSSAKLKHSKIPLNKTIRKSIKLNNKFNDADKWNGIVPDLWSHGEGELYRENLVSDYFAENESDLTAREKFPLDSSYSSMNADYSINKPLKGRSIKMEEIKMNTKRKKSSKIKEESRNRLISTKKNKNRFSGLDQAAFAKTHPTISIAETGAVFPCRTPRLSDKLRRGFEIINAARNNIISIEKMNKADHFMNMSNEHSYGDPMEEKLDLSKNWHELLSKNNDASKMNSDVSVSKPSKKAVNFSEKLSSIRLDTISVGVNEAVSPKRMSIQCLPPISIRGECRIQKVHEFSIVKPIKHLKEEDNSNVKIEEFIYIPRPKNQMSETNILQPNVSTQNVSEESVSKVELHENRKMENKNLSKRTRASSHITPERAKKNKFFRAILDRTSSNHHQSSTSENNRSVSNTSLSRNVSSNVTYYSEVNVGLVHTTLTESEISQMTDDDKIRNYIATTDNLHSNIKVKKQRKRSPSKQNQLRSSNVGHRSFGTQSSSDIRVNRIKTNEEISNIRKCSQDVIRMIEELMTNTANITSIKKPKSAPTAKGNGLEVTRTPNISIMSVRKCPSQKNISLQTEKVNVCSCSTSDVDIPKAENNVSTLSQKVKPVGQKSESCIDVFERIRDDNIESLQHFNNSKRKVTIDKSNTKQNIQCNRKSTDEDIKHEADGLSVNEVNKKNVNEPNAEIVLDKRYGEIQGDFFFSHQLKGGLHHKFETSTSTCKSLSTSLITLYQTEKCTGIGESQSHHVLPTTYKDQQLKLPDDRKRSKTKKKHSVAGNHKIGRAQSNSNTIDMNNKTVAKEIGLKKKLLDKPHSMSSSDSDLNTSPIYKYMMKDKVKNSGGQNRNRHPSMRRKSDTSLMKKLTLDTDISLRSTSSGNNTWSNSGKSSHKKHHSLDNSFSESLSRISQEKIYEYNYSTSSIEYHISQLKMLGTESSRTSLSSLSELSEKSTLKTLRRSVKRNGLANGEVLSAGEIKLSDESEF